LLEVLKAWNIKQVVVTRLERLAGDAMLSPWLMKEIKKLGAELVSIAEPGRWDDPIQKLLLTMVVINRPGQSHCDRVLWTFESLKGMADRHELRARSRMTLAELNAVLIILAKENKITIEPKRTGR
jgi:hypothetical protein